MCFLELSDKFWKLSTNAKIIFGKEQLGLKIFD